MELLPASKELLPASKELLPASKELLPASKELLPASKERSIEKSGQPWVFAVPLSSLHTHARHTL